MLTGVSGLYLERDDPLEGKLYFAGEESKIQKVSGYFSKATVIYRV